MVTSSTIGLFKIARARSPPCLGSGESYIRNPRPDFNKIKISIGATYKRRNLHLFLVLAWFQQKLPYKLEDGEQTGYFSGLPPIPPSSPYYPGLCQQRTENLSGERSKERRKKREEID
jgi:hypothetical protein